MEIWKDIIGYEKLYKISTFGNVYSYKSNKILTSKINNKGYCGIELIKNNHRKMYLIHRLVAIHFIPNYDSNKTIINHIDENPLNNIVSNLEWCNYSYNTNYSIYKRKLTESNVRKSINKDTNKKIKRLEDGVIFNNSLEIKKIYGFKQSSILECCRNKRHSAYGYQWQFA